MYPRKTLDIEWTDLAFSAAACVRPGDREREARRVEALWSGDGREFLASLSVRSAFDLLLECLALPEGSEILVSAVTIRDMIRIIRRHGLVPVPVDLDMDSVRVRMTALERAAGPRTRAVLVAHLFGSRMPLDGVADFARTHDLLLLEDCAQAFAADGYRGHPESDIVFFSFGPIKSRTALGGALTRVGEPALLQGMRRLQSRWPVRGRSWFLARTLKYAGVSLVLTRGGMRVLDRFARLIGTSHDRLLSRAVRGFPGPRFFRQIRMRPPYPLLALLHRRLRTLEPGAYRERTERGKRAAELLDGLPRPGAEAAAHSHWVFPACPGDPDGLMRRLWRAGFDATRGASSLAVVPVAPERPEIDAPEARGIMERVLYLPVYGGLSEAALLELASAVAAHGEAGGTGRRSGPDSGDPTLPSSGFEMEARVWPGGPNA